MTWRSICWGRDLFEKGFRWKVGNGNYIHLNEDPWIPRNGNYKLSTVPDSLKGKTVSAIIDENNKWRKDLISHTFDPQDKEDILSIPLGSKNSKDEIIWGER